jgi:hypothetical protein
VAFISICKEKNKEIARVVLRSVKHLNILSHTKTFSKEIFIKEVIT